MFYQLDAGLMEKAEELGVCGSDFELLVKVAIKSDNTLGGCWASNKTLAKSLKMNFYTISRKISKLVRKGLLTVKYLFTGKKRGKKVMINGKEYFVYRVLTPNTKFNNDVKNSRQSKQKKTESSVDDVKKANKTTNGNTSHYQELFKKALEKANERQGVRNVTAYARGVVKQWQKQGIHTLEQLAKHEEKQALVNNKGRNQKKQYGKRKKITEKMPYWFNKKQEEVQKSTEDTKTLNQEIFDLMDKLGIKQNVAQN